MFSDILSVLWYGCFACDDCSCIHCTVPVPSHQKSPEGVLLESGVGLRGSWHTCDQSRRSHWPTPALTSSPALWGAPHHQSGGWKRTLANVNFSASSSLRSINWLSCKYRLQLLMMWRVGEHTGWICRSTAETCEEGSSPGRRRTGGHPETESTESNERHSSLFGVLRGRTLTCSSESSSTETRHH